MKKIFIVVIVLILLMVGVIVWLSLSHKSTQQTTEQTTNQPDIKVTDYSQGVPTNQKTVIVVEHSDSSFEKIIVPSSNVETFVKTLPEGDKVAGTTPPISQ
jgi:uncharacterized alpha/beta hydrolase family protein